MKVAKATALLPREKRASNVTFFHFSRARIEITSYCSSLRAETHDRRANSPLQTPTVFHPFLHFSFDFAFHFPSTYFLFLPLVSSRCPIPGRKSPSPVLQPWAPKACASRLNSHVTWPLEPSVSTPTAVSPLSITPYLEGAINGPTLTQTPSFSANIETRRARSTTCSEFVVGTEISLHVAARTQR